MGEVRKIGALLWVSLEIILNLANNFKHHLKIYLTAKATISPAVCAWITYSASLSPLELALLSVI